VGGREVVFFEAEDGIRDWSVTGVQTCALPISSLTPADVPDPGGVAEAFGRLRADGLVRFVGLTGTGTAEALGAVIDAGGFDTVRSEERRVGKEWRGRGEGCR